MNPDTTIVIAVISAVAGLTGWAKVLYDIWVKRRIDNAQARQIDRSTDTDSFQITSAMVKEWMAAADSATKEVLAARRKIGAIEDILRDGIRMMREAGINADEIEQDLEKALAAGFNGSSTKSVVQ